MIKAVLPFIGGIVLGGGIVLLGSGRMQEEQAREMAAPQVLSCEASTAPLQARLVELEGKLERQEVDGERVKGSQLSNLQMDSVSSPSADEIEAHEAQLAEATRWRISAIEKFVPLSEDQKQRLSDKFMKEANSEDGEVETESLEAILGDESASFYRQQVRAAFQRVQDEETEKEVVWVSRQLSLSLQQEQGVRDVYLRVEQQVQAELSSEKQSHSSTSSQDRVKLMVQENRLRNTLRQSMLKDVLSPEQYQVYLKNESESASSEMEVFHDPGGS